MTGDETKPETIAASNPATTAVPGIAYAAAQVTLALNEWVAGLDAAIEGANLVIDTPACPVTVWPLPAGKTLKQLPNGNPKTQSYQETDEEYAQRRRVAVQTCATLVHFGLHIGFQPDVALNSIFIVGGRYAMYADAMAALVRSKGHGHRLIERTSERCVIEVRRSGETDWTAFDFTIEDAVNAGYVRGAGPNVGEHAWKGNDAYARNPKGMLYARCNGIACRAVFPDVLRGIDVYETAVEETRDDTPMTGSPEPVAPLTKPRRITAADIIGVPFTHEVYTGNRIADSPYTETPRNLLQELYAKLRHVGVGDRDRGLALLTGLLERDEPLNALKDLTSLETHQALELLETLEAKPEPERGAAITFLTAGPPEPIGEGGS